MINRRRFLQALGSLGLATVPKVAPAQCPRPGPVSRVCFEAAPFTLGVASGDPRADAVMLWTRLAPEPIEPDGGLRQDGIGVSWALASDPEMRRVVRQGSVRTRRSEGHAVHVDAGGLVPGTTYYYRFASGGRSSRIGRTRTAPDERAGTVRFGVVACQDFVARYGAFRHLAAEPLDFVAHLGDSIYESSIDGRPAEDLSSYRRKHALFRGDPLAREAWAAHPFVVTWDDHEVRNNYWGTDPALDGRRAAAYQAYYEHMPLRLPAGPPAEWNRLRVYRDMQFGELLELDLLDLRQYRSGPAGAAHSVDAGRTLLGADQKAWLLGRLRSTSARWSCLGSSVFMGEYRGNPDAWDGYAHERAEVLREIRDHAAGRVVVASGDWHRALVSLLLAGDGAGFRGGRAVAIEFGTPAISSKAAAPERPDPDAGFAARAGAPWVLYEDHGYRGYTVCEVRRDAWRATYRVLRDGASDRMTTLAAFQVPRGAPGRVTWTGFVPFG